MMISSTITSRNAAPTSVPLMPSKTLIASAEMPAGPATFTCRPSLRSSLTAFR